MRLRLIPLLALLLCLSTSGVMHAQVHQSAVGEQRELWAGAGYSNYDPDYNIFRIYGVTFFGDYVITHRFAAEAEVRLLNFNKPDGLTEKTYLLGPLARLYQFHHLTAFAKVLIGGASVHYPNDIGYGSYFAFAPGGGVDYRFGQRWKLRGEYDYDFLPGAPGTVLTYPNPSNGLTPQGITVGISYRVF